MATATQFRDGFWLIEWNANLTSGSAGHASCAQTSFQLTCSIKNWDDVTLTVIQTKGAALSGNSSKPCSPQPQKVQALYANQMKEMVSTGQGTWATVSWPYSKTTYDTGHEHTYIRLIDYEYQFANFKLIIEFTHNTSFAEGERRVLTHLSNLLDTQSMADVTFVVKNERIGAHTAIVVSGSPVICAMLEEDKFKEGRTKIVEVNDIEPVVFKEMLRYLYTGKAPKMDENKMTEPLFVAADKYQIKALKDLCEKSLIKKLTIQTVVHYLVLAHLFTAPQLLEASLKFLVSSKKEIITRPEWKELIQNYPDLFFLATNRMVG